MKMRKKVLSVLLVLAMVASGMGAVPAALRDDPAEPVQAADLVQEADASGETDGTAEPVQSGEPAADEPEQSGETGGTNETDEADEQSGTAVIASVGEPLPIAAEDVTVKWDIEPITYGDNVSAIQAAVTATLVGSGAAGYSGPTYTYAKTDGTELSNTPDAGEYKVTATWKSTSGGEDLKETKEFTIAKAELTLRIAVNIQKFYDGTEQTLWSGVNNNISVKGAKFQDRVTVTGTIKGTKVGTYGVEAADDFGVEITNNGVDKRDNYKIDASGIQITINPTTLELTIKGQVTKPYTGSNIVLTADDVDGTLKGSDRIESITADAVDAGDYTGGSDLEADTWVILDGDNNNVSDCYTVEFTSGTLTVTAQSLDNATLTFPEVVYNGEVQTSPPTEVKLENGTVVTAGYTLAYDPQAPKDAGTSVTVTATGNGNLTGTATGEYTIGPRDLKDADVTASLTPDSAAAYDKTEKTITVDATYNGTALREGADYSVAYLRDGKVTDDLTKVGAITVRLTGMKNFKGTRDLTFTITERDINAPEVTVTKPEDKEYNGQAQELKPEVKDGNDTLKEGDDYEISYSNDTKNVGTVTVTVTGKGNYSGDRTVAYKITHRPVTVNVTGSKKFGAVDPEDPMAAELLVNEKAPAGEGYFVTVSDVPEEDKMTFPELISFGIQRDEGEVPGDYAVRFVGTDAAKATNYTVTFAEDGKLAIKTDAAFTVALDEPEITTHDTEAAFTITEVPGAKLIEDLKKYVDIRLDIDKSKVGDNMVAASVEGEPYEIPASVPMKEDPAALDKKGVFTLPTVPYEVDGYKWESGLPAKAELTVTVTSKEPGNGNTAAAGAIVQSVTPVPVKAVDGSMVVEYVSGENMTAFEDEAGERTLVDQNATVLVYPLEDDAANISDGDWIMLTVGELTHVYCVNDTSELGEDVEIEEVEGLPTLTLTLDQLKLLAGVSGEEGEWFGANPAGSVKITAVLLDGLNHTSEPASQVLAFDTGTRPSTQDVENRAEAITITLEEPVGSDQPTVTGTFGGSTPQITSDGTQTLTWANIADWKNTPGTLPHSGDVITITYKDRVGNEGTHTLNVVKSAAATYNTIYVKPMTDRTVPSGKLNFYGETNVWEPLTVTIGGTSFSVDPLAGGAVYDNSSRQWNVVVDLGDINFPVGQPTRASAAYDELLGGDADIVITYKDAAQEPVMGSEAVVGSTALWGYVESSTSVMIDVRHADGTVTAVPADNVAVDQFGYFYARLNEALAEGDVIVITTTDFCGNTRRIEQTVQTKLRDGAFAEVLGANIIGRTLSGSMEHRFATPIDLSALSAGQSMELPILAYKGIEIGRVTISLSAQGKVEAKYNITAGSFVPANGTARVSTYTGKPDIEELVNGEHKVVIKDLRTAASGQLVSVDVSDHQAADGSYGGVIWLYAEFDVKMDEASYINRGGRTVSFYRWLTENLQTETLLNAVYSEMSAYKDNTAFYGQYQRFESISRTY